MLKLPIFLGGLTLCCICACTGGYTPSEFAAEVSPHFGTTPGTAGGTGQSSLASPSPLPAAQDPNPIMAPVPPDRADVDDGLTAGTFVAAPPVEYHFPFVLDTNVVADANIEYWASLYLPQSQATGPSPLVVLMHGAHDACSGYATRAAGCEAYMAGACPSNAVIDNHRGYDYLAQRLVSHGYAVVSINNNAVHCYKVITESTQQAYVRGRLLLRHLELLSGWSRSGGAPDSLGLGPNGLLGRIDFSSVTLFGHSRGGEGVRSAYLTLSQDTSWQQRLPQVKITGVFEFAPTDGLTGTLFEDHNVPWAVALPQCDGDVYPLQGMRPFDRLITQRQTADSTPKAVVALYGANHNGANTVWAPTPDNLGCVGPNNPAITAQTEQALVMALMSNFVRATAGVAADPNYLHVFNPYFTLPASLTTLTRIDRNYITAASDVRTTSLNDFSDAGGRSPMGAMPAAMNVDVDYGQVDTISPQDFITHTAKLSARVAWSRAGADVYYQLNWTEVGNSLDLSTYATIDWRITRLDTITTSNNPAGDTDISVQLIDANDKPSQSVDLGTYLSLSSPVGSITLSTQSGLAQFYHVLLQTVRIPVSDFKGIDLTKVRGVRLIFDGTSRGDIAIADLIASKTYE